MIARRAGAGASMSPRWPDFSLLPGALSYGASKSWINTFTEGLWMESSASPSGSPVRVQALCPGFTYSEFHDVAGMDRDKLAPKAWWCSAEQRVVADLARGPGKKTGSS